MLIALIEPLSINKNVKNTIRKNYAKIDAR